MKLILNPKSVYGTDKFYPGCDRSRKFADLLQQTTFTQRDMRILRELGYALEFKHVFTKEQPFL